MVGSDDDGERAAVIYSPNGTVSSRTWIAKEVCVTCSSASPSGRPPDKVGDELNLQDGQAVMLHYQDPTEKFEVSAVLSPLPKPTRL